MSALALAALLGLEGNPKGFLAALLVLVWVAVLFGTPYVMLAAIYGAKQGYLVMGTAVSIVMILLGAIWLFGAPGTVPGTGPRGSEPRWVPFLATSEQAQDFGGVRDFPSGWDRPGKKYSGNVDSAGELKTLQEAWTTALSERAASQGLTTATKVADWDYRITDSAASPEEQALPRARVYFTDTGKRLVAGIEIPATSKHPEVAVFAYRDTGQVFYWAAVLFGASVVAFVLHVAGLAALEKRKKLPAGAPA